MIAAADASAVGPGLLGFLVMFGLALALIVLVRSMVGHLRKVRYSAPPDVPPPAEQDAERDADQPRD
jgi:hypothetical protein